MTYEDLPDIIRQKLFYSHQHDKNGFIVYPEKVVLECLEMMLERSFKLHKANRWFLYAESQMGLNYPVHDIEMPWRLKNLLENQFMEAIGLNEYGYFPKKPLTLGDIVRHPESAFLKVRNFGPIALKELKEILSELGLSLAPEETTPTQK